MSDKKDKYKEANKYDQLVWIIMLGAIVIGFGLCFCSGVTTVGLAI